MMNVIFQNVLSERVYKMISILSKGEEKLSEGKNVVLVTVAHSQGSTPGKTGAAMIVSNGKVIGGTIGGGELEYKCTEIAMDTVGLRHFELDNGKAAQLGMICGGQIDILFTPLKKESKFIDKIMSINKDCKLLLSLDGSAYEIEDGADTDKAYLDEERSILVLPLKAREKVVIFGGGHVSFALTKILDFLKMSYIIIDEREEFCNSQRFPNAERLYTGNDLISVTDLDSRTAVCIMTRGHEGDALALRLALKSQAGYIGLMGSRRKREKIFAQLKDEGFENPESRIITPIGLDIGGNTPEEIAISVAAQLISWKNG